MCTFGPSVSPKGSIQANPTTINGNHSGNATFNCIAMGGPGNEFSWTKVRGYTVVVNDSKLTLVGLMAPDGGQYQCTVENRAGNDNTTVILNSKTHSTKINVCLDYKHPSKLYPTLFDLQVFTSVSLPQ